MVKSAWITCYDGNLFVSSGFTEYGIRRSFQVLKKKEKTKSDNSDKLHFIIQEGLNKKRCLQEVMLCMQQKEAKTHRCPSFLTRRQTQPPSFKSASELRVPECSYGSFPLC